MAYKEPKILGLMPHWHIRTKNEASWHPSRGYKYMIERSSVSGGWEAWIFVPDAPTGVRVSGTAHYLAYEAAKEAEADARARGISGAPNRAGRAGRVENEYGLTFAEWLAAAGGLAYVEAVIAFGRTARQAWRDGEDPTEYRAADAAKIRAFKERHNMARIAKQKVWYVAGYNYPKGHRDRRLKYSGGKFASKTDATRAARDGRAHGFHMEVTARRPKTWWDPMPIEEAIEEGERRFHPGTPRHVRARVLREDAAARNQAGGRSNPLSAPTRVATFAQLGHEWDPSAFYSVKGGKIYERQRIGGGGYGRGRLSKAKWVGAVPGFKKSLFYSVVDGVVVARKRK